MATLSSSSKLNLEGIMLFEQPFAKVRVANLTIAMTLNLISGSVRELPQSIPHIPEEHREGVRTRAKCCCRLGKEVK